MLCGTHLLSSQKSFNPDRMDTQYNMSEKLLQLPLFQGLSSSDLSHAMGHTRLEFIQGREGEALIEENEPCDSLCFLMKGTIHVTTWCDDYSYSVTEELSAPDILQPESLFGLNQRYSQTFVAATDCHLLKISKVEVLRLADHHEIFRTNLLNILTTQTQRLSRRVWHPYPVRLRDKIVRFVMDRCRKPAGKKIVCIKMQQLAVMIGESRLNVSHALHSMEQEGLIMMSRGRIEIPAFQKLIY